MEAKKADLSKQRIGHSRAEAVRLFPHLVLDQYKSCTKPPKVSTAPQMHVSKSQNLTIFLSLRCFIIAYFFINMGLIPTRLVS